MANSHVLPLTVREAKVFKVDVGLRVQLSSRVDKSLDKLLIRLAPDSFLLQTQV
jgi:hypothetical protein